MIEPVFPLAPKITYMPSLRQRFVFRLVHKRFSFFLYVD